jgi:hypothetical protein
MGDDELMLGRDRRNGLRRKPHGRAVRLGVQRLSPRQQGVSAERNHDEHGYSPCAASIK